MEPVVLALEKKYHGKVEFVIVDVRTPEGNDLASEYRVSYIPAFYLMDSKGNVTFTEVGPQPQGKLDKEISKNINNK